jgi:hypothetical protein
MDPESGVVCNPAFLGPLDDDFTPVTGPVKVFAGEEKFLSARKLDARVNLCREVAPVLRRVLDEDETVLHILPVLHYPRFLEFFGFGVWWTLFFRATLIVTDRRVIEVLMRDAKRPGTRVCSYSWGQASSLKFSMATLKLKPAQGRTQKWKIIERGDRKLLKLVVPNIQQLLPGDIHAPRPVPLWHCPECGAASPDHPKQCAHCQARFKTRGLAAALALAFPGAGLLYAEHPILATLDLFGEAFMYLLVAVMFIFAADPAEMFAAFVVGLVILFFTKLESAHMASVLVHRTKADRQNTKWRRVAIAGAVVSLVLMVIPPVLSGSFGNSLDRDMDLSANGLGWTGSYNPEEWHFGVEADQRSEWIGEDGQSLFVWSWAMSAGESYESLAAAFDVGDQEVPVEYFEIGGVDGFRVVQTEIDEEGDPYFWVRWVLFDREYEDVHVVGTAAYPSQVDEAVNDVEQLLQSATWIEIDGSSD